MSADAPVAPDRVRTILCVCTGNSCRSVMAQGLLRQALKTTRPDIEVLSAGVGTWGGMGATAETLAVLRARGVDMAGHVSRPVTAELAGAADLIVAMETSHREILRQRYPEAAGKVVLLKTFLADGPVPDPDLPDPIGQSLEGYEQCVRVIQEAVSRITRWLAPR